MTTRSSEHPAGTAFELKPYLEKIRRQVNAALEAFIPETEEQARISRAMRYSLMAGGKRLRPVLCIAAAESVGGRPSDVMSAACALEMIHTYSLIHDDLPAMDDDALRRGKPTCHTAFDEATAILAGDALLTYAFQLLASSARKSTLDAFLWLDTIETIARAAGHQGMIEGQMRDIRYEGKTIGPSDLERLHDLKTGALIKAAVKTGAALGGGSPDQMDALDEYASRIGLAFQVADDVLNVEGDPTLLGKAVGTDEARKKTTYPALLGLESSKGLARSIIKDALEFLDGFDRRADPLRAIAVYIVNRKR